MSFSEITLVTHILLFNHIKMKLKKKTSIDIIKKNFRDNMKNKKSERIS